MSSATPTQAKVSIVVPVYNKIEYIDMMLESVYNQHWDNIEIILVNDEATDGTRERLSVWQLKFLKRGYEVIIVDQKNQGIPGAVKSGLLRVTGDYVCLSDCDDVLEPEYVSAMAGWLEEHSEDQWAACLYNRVSIKNGIRKLLSTIDVSEIPSPPLMMEKYLSKTFVTEVWIYMVRTDYLRACKVAENFVTDIRSTQEPGFLFPLIEGGGSLKVLPYPLYNHHLYDEQTSAMSSVNYLIEFQNLYRDIIVKTISTLGYELDIKQRLSYMAELAHKRSLTWLGNQPDAGEHMLRFAQEAAELIGALFQPNPNITAEHILECGYEVLSKAVSDCILGNDAPPPITLSGRVIGVGALGSSGKKSIPALIGTPLNPVELWDHAAVQGDSVCGIPVKAPDYGLLTKDDTVLIFPREPQAKAALSKAAADGGARRIICCDDIEAYQAAWRYPQFYKECKFIG